jgi:hypothetical protein
MKTKAKKGLGITAFLEGMAGAGFIIFVCLFSPLLKGWYRSWGATPAETKKRLPGDGLVPRPRMQSTRALTIQAPPAAVWPWLLQFGLKRGGWYSYDFLEAISGAADFIDGRSTWRIIPELQRLKVGDKIWMHPRIMPLTVSAIEPERALIFHTRVDLATKAFFELGKKMPANYVNSHWVFFLERSGKKATRLLVRSRLDYGPANLMNTIAWRVFTDPISFVMERRMLLNIKKRAEGMGGSSAYPKAQP